MFKKMNLAIKIGGGFGTVILFLTIVSSVSWLGLKGMADGFTTYRSLARNSNLAGNLQSSMLALRLSVEEYIQRSNEENIKIYQSHRVDINNILSVAQKDIHNPERAKIIDEYSSDIVAYDKAFDQLVEWVKKRNRIVKEVLSAVGPAMEKNLTEIMTSAETNKDVEAAYEAGNALRYMLLGRLYGQKFLDINSKENEELALAQFDQFEERVGNLAQVLQNPQLLRTNKEIIEQAKSYMEAFRELAATIYSRNEIITSELDVMGPEMAGNVDELKRSYQEDQDALGPVVQAKSRTSMMIDLFVSITAILLGITAAFFITRSITMPIRQVVDFVKVLEEGDFTMDLEIDQEDEIGTMSRALGTTVKQLGTMIKEIINGVNTLTSSSTELSAVSSQLSGNSEDTSARSIAVASAAEEMSANMHSVSAAMEQSSSNVGMVATATEEMTSTVNEIAQNAAKAKDISEKAVEQSNRTSGKINELGQAATKIGKVTEAITEISEQTNLLALNATIEAARAGEAGKGFAVVANEIKDLAKQTATATVDIKNQIDEMQGTTNSTIADIETISQVINDINNVINSIATAVEQQSAATSEIAANIAQASTGIAEVNENVAQSSMAASDITKEIGSISSGSEEISQGSKNVKDSANELSKLAEQLNGFVSRFKIA